MTKGFLRFLFLHCVVLLLIMAFAAARGVAAQSTTAPKCDRACLEGFVNQYLEALAARDPSRVPFATNVKFTENTAKLKIGEGSWGTFNGQGAFKLYFAEPEAGQVGFIGVMKEWDNPVIFCLRLKVTGGKIAEVEDFVVRDTGAGKNLDAIGQPNPKFLEAVPPAERETREELVKTANMYFSGLQNNDGKGAYPFTPDCNRIENGTQTTNNPGPYKRDPTTGNWVMSLGCEAQFKTGFFRIVTRIRDRRFVIVDRERGLAFAFGFFDHAGTVKSIPLTNGAVVPATLRHPFTWEIGEVFKIEKGKIRAVQAALTQEPYGIKSGWGPEGEKSTPPARLAKAESSNCDRKCLNDLVDRYRAALVEHNASLMPLAPNARYTENSQDLKFTDGLWGTLTGWGGYTLYIDDPEEGEVGFVGVTDEAGMAGLLCTRLRVVNRKITEIEALITRKETAAGFTRPDGLTDPKVAPKLAGFFEDVPESERESRTDLIAQTDLYFDGIEKSSGSIVPFAPDVIRVENGTQTCPSTFGALSKDGKPTSCAAGLDSHLFEYIYPISPRRYTVVDRQRGIVMGNFMFNTSGKVEYVNVPGVGKVRESAAALRPFSEEVDEIFKIKDGKIDSIIAVMTGLPYGDTSGWPPAYWNSAEGLKRLLEDVRFAAGTGDTTLVTKFLKETEIPNCAAWLHSMYDPDKADSWMGLCNAKELSTNEMSMQKILTGLAGGEGEVVTRKVNDNPEPGKGLEWGWLQSLKRPLDIYFASWRPSEGSDKELRDTPIGYFMFIDGAFRWESGISSVRVEIRK